MMWRSKERKGKKKRDNDRKSKKETGTTQTEREKKELQKVPAKTQHRERMEMMWDAQCGWVANKVQWKAR